MNRKRQDQPRVLGQLTNPSRGRQPAEDNSALPSVVYLGEAIITNMNRSAPTDSINELDGITQSRSRSDMVEPKLQIVLQRRDCARNVARFYVLAIEPSLYGDAALMRAWGRIGSLGRQRIDLYASLAEAGEALEVWLARKVRRGYMPVTADVEVRSKEP